MKILFFGDLVGRPARKILNQVIPVYKNKYTIDLVIANADNLAHGRGVTKNTVKEITKYGVDVATCGDHIWDTKEAVEIIKDKKYNLLCPANLPLFECGAGYRVVKAGLRKVLVINLMGRVFFRKYPKCPFSTADEIIKTNSNIDIIIVDFHCEATSEKKALGFYLDSRVSAVLGTHTHIQTADEEILKGGTAYISDVGMVGPKDSILGCKKDVVINQMLTQTNLHYEISNDKNVLINAAVLDIDNNGKTRSISRINEVMRDVDA